MGEPLLGTPGVGQMSLSVPSQRAASRGVSGSLFSSTLVSHSLKFCKIAFLNRSNPPQPPSTLPGQQEVDYRAGSSGPPVSPLSCRRYRRSERYSAGTLV